MTEDGIAVPVSSTMARPNIAPSDGAISALQTIYPPTMETSVTKGPSPASVYCARPPVRFGINAFSSARDAAVIIFSAQARTIETINIPPIAAEPWHSDIRHVVATINPTPVETTLNRPNFFSFIAYQTPSGFNPARQLHPRRYGRGQHRLLRKQKSCHHQYVRYTGIS